MCGIFVGMNEVNYDKFPDEEFQRKWIRTYLHKKRAAVCKTIATVIMAA